jgi:hypothetical protein
VLLTIFPSLNPPAEAHQETDDRADQENHEKNLCDARRADGDPAESEERSNQRDDEKYYRIMKHDRTFGLWAKMFLVDAVGVCSRRLVDKVGAAPREA